MSEMWKVVKEQLQSGHDLVIATILSSKGSAPREMGTKFLVLADGRSVGTIGGGLFEAQVINIAVNALTERKSRIASFEFTGTDSNADKMICGGQVEVLIEFVAAADNDLKLLFTQVHELIGKEVPMVLLTELDFDHDNSTANPLRHTLVFDMENVVGGFTGDREAISCLGDLKRLKTSQQLEFKNVPPVLVEPIKSGSSVFIFGAGHVGVAVAHLAAYTHFRVVILDDRSEFAAQERVPEADRVMVIKSLKDAFSELNVDSESYIVIVTRGHAHDKDVLAEALRTPAVYIGMIGSRRKIALIYQGLKMEGYTEEDFKRVHAPIGLDIGGETPQEIAIAIVAEMIALRHDGNSKEKQTHACPA